MEKKEKNLVGVCGLYCGTCPFFLAFRQNDSDMLRKISQEKGMPIDDLRCDGCLSDRVSRHCAECAYGFRKCASDHGVDRCFECTDFPCERLQGFKDVHVVNNISHHEHVIEDLADMKANGIEPWIEKQEKDNRCPACGKTLYWFDRTCSDCQREIR